MIDDFISELPLASVPHYEMLDELGKMLIHEDRADIGYLSYKGRKNHYWKGKPAPNHPSPFHHYHAGTGLILYARVMGSFAFMRDMYIAYKESEGEAEVQESIEIEAYDNDSYYHSKEVRIRRPTPDIQINLEPLSRLIEIQPIEEDGDRDARPLFAKSGSGPVPIYALPQTIETPRKKTKLTQSDREYFKHLLRR